MIDYDAKRTNALLGGLSADDILWRGRETKIRTSIDEDGIINGFCISYLADDDTYNIQSTMIQTENKVRLYQMWITHKTKTFRNIYLPDDVTEENFTKAFVLLKRNCIKRTLKETNE